MPRENVSTKEQRKKDSGILATYFFAAQTKDTELTQDSIAAEMNVTQGMVQKWLNGGARISTPRLIWLGKRLNFDPKIIRPELDSQADASATTEREKLWAALARVDSNFAHFADALAKASPFYDKIARLKDQVASADPQVKSANKK
jgi:transcriptional regulator with XRE-family HTH domain